jgi:tetratricopeptide (TPR) repeat protein
MAETQDSSPRWRRWLPRILTAVLAPVLILVITEVALRAGGVGFSTDLLTPCTIQGKPGACYNLFFVAPFFPPGMIRTPQVYAIPDAKPQRTYRIAVLGESAAMGDPDPAYAFSRYLEVMLEERFPNVRFEVINTGSVAINSHVLLPIAKGLAGEKFDAFIIYSGNNEVVGPYGPGTELTKSAMSLPVIRASMYFHATRIGQLATRVGAQKREWGGMEMFLDKQIPASSPLMTSVYHNFESNLRETVDVARQAGAKVLVSTVVTNVRDCAPFASMHRAGLAKEKLAAWNSLVAEGEEQEKAMAYADALKSYQAAAAIDDDYAELEFRIAQCLWKMNDIASAKPHYLRARDLDTLRFRADGKINEINRRVAAASGAELVDAESILASASQAGIVGSDLVYEHVHLTPRGNYLMARAMLEKLTGSVAAVAGAEQKDSLLSEEECERRLGFTEYDRARITTEMLNRLQKEPFTGQHNHAEQVLALVFQTNVPPEDPQQTAAEYQWAIARRPEDKLLHHNYAAFLWNIDREQALTQYSLSRAWDGFPVVLPDGMYIP